jgi:phage tail-like protein
MAATRFDPHPAYCFRVELTGVPGSNASAFFKSVSGLKYETEVVDYQEGGLNRYVHRLVGPTKWGNIVLKRGFIKGFDLVKWRELWLREPPLAKRVSGKITQLDTKLATVCSWSFRNGWPCKWEISEFDASKNELAIETIEIAHNGLGFQG